jgi:hypothetical protein
MEPGISTPRLADGDMLVRIFVRCPEDVFVVRQCFPNRRTCDCPSDTDLISSPHTVTVRSSEWLRSAYCNHGGTTSASIQMAEPALSRTQVPHPTRHPPNFAVVKRAFSSLGALVNKWLVRAGVVSDEMNRSLSGCHSTGRSSFPPRCRVALS